MGNSNSIAVDSYLDRHQCSGRNITWHYMHNNGSLPSPYSTCTFAPEVLSAHCCSKGVCKPTFMDKEFERYANNDWDGLGDPYKHTTTDRNATRKEYGPGRLTRRGYCFGIAGPGVGGSHWPPLGLDGRPTKNFDFYEWVPSDQRKLPKNRAVGAKASTCSSSATGGYPPSGAFCEGIEPRSVPMSLTQYYDSNVSNRTPIWVTTLGLVGLVFPCMVRDSMGEIASIVI